MSVESRENSGAAKLPVNFQGGYCVLAYRPDILSKLLESASPLFMLVLDDERSLRLFLNPNWREFVQAQDLEYLEMFIPDVKERAQEFPRQLLNQLASLSLGPLVTLETGGNFSEHPALAELFSLFVPL
jgi:hypothetical protein